MILFPPPDEITRFGYYQCGNEVYKYSRKDGLKTMKLLTTFETVEEARAARKDFVINEPKLPYEEVYGIPHEEAVKNYFDEVKKFQSQGF